MAHTDDDVTLVGYLPETGQCIVAVDEGRVVVEFDKTCLGFRITPEQALAWGNAFITAAEMIEPVEKSEVRQSMARVIDEMFPGSSN